MARPFVDAYFLAHSGAEGEFIEPKIIFLAWQSSSEVLSVADQPITDMKEEDDKRQRPHFNAPKNSAPWPCANKPKSEIRPALRHEFQLQLQLQIWLSGCPWRNLRFHINGEFSQHSPSLFSLPFKAPCKAHLGFSLLHLHLWYTSYNMSHAGLRGHLAQDNIVQ